MRTKSYHIWLTDVDFHKREHRQDIQITMSNLKDRKRDSWIREKMKVNAAKR